MAEKPGGRQSCRLARGKRRKEGDTRATTTTPTPPRAHPPTPCGLLIHRCFRLNLPCRPRVRGGGDIVVLPKKRRHRRLVPEQEQPPEDMPDCAGHERCASLDSNSTASPAPSDSDGEEEETLAVCRRKGRVGSVGSPGRPAEAGGKRPTPAAMPWWS